jgi:hypothetical protein
MNGGKVRSPVHPLDLEPAAAAFGASAGAARDQLDALNGSLLLLAQDDEGPFWTYKHPTVSDAFAHYVAGTPELVEIYLRGARPESIVREVVCAGVQVYGAPVVVPASLHSLLAERIKGLEGYNLVSFMSYRSNRTFSALMLEKRPDILDRLKRFLVPLKDDIDASLLARLHEQELLPEEIRLNFVEELRRAAVEEADASFLDDGALEAILTQQEKNSILDDVESKVLPQIDQHVGRVRNEWKKEYPPEDHFEGFVKAINLFVGALADKMDHQAALRSTRDKVSLAVSEMSEDYEPSSPTASPTASSTPRSAPLVNLFRDVDE